MEHFNFTLGVGILVAQVALVFEGICYLINSRKGE